MHVSSFDVTALPTGVEDYLKEIHIFNILESYEVNVASREICHITIQRREFVTTEYTRGLPPSNTSTHLQFVETSRQSEREIASERKKTNVWLTKLGQNHFTGMVAGADRRTAQTDVPSSCHADSEEAAAVLCADVVESIRLGSVDRPFVAMDGMSAGVMGND
jgi:hypothetical protein